MFKNYEEARKKSILITLVGSRAYGTNNADSDWDEKGVIIGPLSCYLGLDKFDQVSTENQDKVIYNIDKFFHLALATNPNIFDVLWGEDILHINHLGKQLRANRDVFLSRKARYSYSGYAYSQLKRIKGHRGYLMGDHPKAPPNPEDFGIDPDWQIGRDELKAIESLGTSIMNELEEQFYKRVYTVGDDGRISFDKEKAVDVIFETLKEDQAIEAGALQGISKDVMQAFWRVKNYRAKLRDWRKYQDWKKSRNPARAELENKYGYDVKHAHHLIRLMRQGIEIIRDGKVIIKRPDAEELLAIRNGAWSYEKIVEQAEELEKQLDSSYQNSPLPKQPNRKKAEELLMDLICQSNGIG